MSTTRYELIFTAEADITSGPSYEAAQKAAQEQEQETQGEEPDNTEESS